MRRCAPIATSRGFKGALVFGADDCASVVPLWFWTSRCLAMPPSLHFGTSALPFLGELCQYGNLHFDFYDAALMQRVHSLAAASGLGPVEGGCRNEFGSGAAMAGRRLRT